MRAENALGNALLYLARCVDAHAAHAVMHAGGDSRNNEIAVVLVQARGEHKLAGPRTRTVLLCRAVGAERLAERLGRAPDHVCASFDRRTLLKQAEAVLVKRQDRAAKQVLSFRREYDPSTRRTELAFREGCTVCLDCSCNDTSEIQLVDKALALFVDQDASRAADRLGRQELGGVVRVLGINKPGGVKLHFVHVHQLGA
mmetsp:Transcript_3303/g.10048  ORF Transcript_3303/g.10048 Transcript_3303/m.10048 type:complete len:200 (-) Transcript_3303:792-1391(-)